MHESRASAIFALTFILGLCAFGWSDLVRIEQPWVYFKPTRESDYAAVVQAQAPNPPQDGVFLGLAIRDTLREGQRVIVSGGIPGAASLADMLGPRITIRDYSPDSGEAQLGRGIPSDALRRYPGRVSVLVGGPSASEYIVLVREGGYVVVPNDETTAKGVAP